MSVQAARRVLLERFAAADLAVVAIHAELDAVPSFADGRDVDGRVVQLVGAHALRTLPEGVDYEQEVLVGLARGEQIPGVHSIRLAPRASEAWAEVVEDGPSSEVMLWGSRNSGKTIVAAMALLSLAECHGRAGYPLPLKVLWLHSSLVDAAMKTGASLEEPAIWAGHWQLQSDRHVAVARVGGREYVYVDFVGVQDVTTVERVRASAHVIVAEELIATLDDQGGIPERAYEIAITSMERLPGRRRVAFSTTNPGSRESWPYTRFLADDHDPRRVACHIPSRDRLSDAQIEAQARPFRDSPDLRARLIEEQWTDLRLGPEVAVGYSPTRHVAAEPQWISPGAPLTIGWDTAPASHVHAAVICQRNGPQIRVFATFCVANGTLKQLVDEKVLPFLLARARWALGEGNAREYLVHAMDPSASTYEGLAAGFTAEQIIKRALGGGKFREGATHWSPRITPLLAVLSPNREVVLKLDPGPPCDLGRRACAEMWHYDVSRGGSIERDAPAKNERIFADVGDALCYAIGEMQPARRQERMRSGHPKKAIGVLRPIR
jgi:hypothetical protein